MSASTETLGPAARRRRNRQIAAARARGETWKAIGKRFGLSDRQWVRIQALRHRRERRRRQAAASARDRPAPVYIDSAAQVEALLEAAGQVKFAGQGDGDRPGGGGVILATLGLTLIALIGLWLLGGLLLRIGGTILAFWRRPRPHAIPRRWSV
jgi:hypothetical protein